MIAKSLAGATVLLTLIVSVSLCCLVSGHPGERQSDEITLEREQIFVSFEDGTTLSVMVEPDDKVEDLWDYLSDYEYVPRYNMTLKLRYDWLRDRVKLSDYNIRPGTRVTLDTRAEARIARTFEVITLDGREVAVATQVDDTVSDLKENIAKLTGISCAEQRLLLWGKELKDERKLIYYTSEHGTRLKLARPLEECHQKVRLFVETLSGATFDVEVDLADTVDVLKEKIWESSGVPTSVQRLFSNKRAITGEDHLCDLELREGSTVKMYFHSSQITSLDQVARLQEVHPIARPIDAHKRPIFREVDDVATSKQCGTRACSIFKDTRNWVPMNGPRPYFRYDQFEPIACLSVNPDNDDYKEWEYTLNKYQSQYPIQEDRLHAKIILAQIKICSSVRPFRVAANITSLKYSKQCAGITLGGGFTDGGRSQISLGADVNNWAPDAFNDLDLMRLFEVAERVRQVLAKSAQTGEGILSIPSQRRINRAILSSYVLALAPYPPSVEYNQEEEKETEECGICRDDLRAEPAILLPCGHTFHADCTLSWLTRLYEKATSTKCPYCRQTFMFHYDALGKAELATPELQAIQDN